MNDKSSLCSPNAIAIMARMFYFSHYYVSICFILLDKFSRLNIHLNKSYCWLLKLSIIQPVSYPFNSTTQPDLLLLSFWPPTTWTHLNLLEYKIFLAYFPSRPSWTDLMVNHLSDFFSISLHILTFLYLLLLTPHGQYPNVDQSNVCFFFLGMD